MNKFVWLMRKPFAFSILIISFAFAFALFIRMINANELIFIISKFTFIVR